MGNCVSVLVAAAPGTFPVLTYPPSPMIPGGIKPRRSTIAAPVPGPWQFSEGVRKQWDLGTQA